MRFAYIDSGGNEVPIPSIDALALRIELGAVGPDTQLYDAQADHWGPACTHEIFHTLSRDAGQDGFVPPPAPAAPVAPPPAAPPTRRPASAPPGAAAPKHKKKAAESAAASGLDLGLTLADPPPEPPEVESPAEDGFADLALDLSAPPAPAKPRSGPTAAPADVGGGFDFGDLGGGLELEGSTPDVGSSEPTTGFGDTLALETPMQFTGGMDIGVPSGGDDLRLDEPASAFGAASPPGWMEQSGGGDVMDFSAVAAESTTPEDALLPAVDAPGRQRRSSKGRPSPPKFKQRSPSGPIVLIVLLLALGVGAYVGWPILSARLAQPDVPEQPVVVLPSLPPEILTRLRTLTEGAIADAITEVDRNSAGGAPSEPDPQWLRGNYLANASRFASIETFWSGMGQFMQGVRGAEWRLYRDKLALRVGAAGIAADTVAMMLERADAGFVSAAAARTEAYADLERLVETALALHDFLVLNDASIDYRPAAVSTADPILEAVPSSPALGDQMEERIADYTGSLDAALGSVDRVTRARLTSALIARLQEVGIE
jgi:hypothetical protein